MGYFSIPRHEFDFKSIDERDRLFMNQVPFSFTTDSGITIPIHRRKITDFASVPRPARNLYSKRGKYTPAAVVHDDLYEKQYDENGNEIPRRLIIEHDLGEIEIFEYSRKWADDVFLEANIALGVNFIDRNALYSAVRVGGWVAWKFGNPIEITPYMELAIEAGLRCYEDLE